MPDSAPALPGIGHNQPPAESQFDPVALAARLSEQYADMMLRFVELEQGAARIPEAVDTEADAQRILEFFAQQCTPLKNDAETAHTAEKAPYLHCGRIVDKFFLQRIRDFDERLAGVKARLARYHARKKEEQRRQEEEQRQRAAAVARRQAEEAARLEAEAKAKAAAGDRRGAVVLGRQAEEAAGRASAAQEIVDAPATPVRIHGGYGSTAFTKEEFDWDVVDMEKIPLGYLMPCEEAIRAAIKRGERDIPGLTIFSREKFQIRKC